MKRQQALRVYQACDTFGSHELIAGEKRGVGVTSRIVMSDEDADDEDEHEGLLSERSPLSIPPKFRHSCPPVHSVISPAPHAAQPSVGEVAPSVLEAAPGSHVLLGHCSDSTVWQMTAPAMIKYRVVLPGWALSSLECPSDLWN